VGGGKDYREKDKNRTFDNPESRHSFVDELNKLKKLFHPVKQKSIPKK
jgi:hypothetical protein